jgi:hypothetical protein
MDIASAFPGKYIKCADLAGKTLIITITVVAMEKVGDDQKPVLRFEGSEQGFVLNKTNADILVNILGTETSEWVGKRVELYPTKVQFGSKMVPAIRVQMAGENEESPFAA